MVSYTDKADSYAYDYMDPRTFHHHITQQGCYLGSSSFAFFVVTLIIAGLGLPLTLIAICTLYSLVRKDHVAPVYVTNLLISDLIRLCCLIVLVQKFPDWKICLGFFYIHHYIMMVSVCFMVVVSLERYLVITRPLWYRLRRNIKTSVIVCVVIWLLPLLFFPIFFFAYNYTETAVASFLLLPFPLFCFFLAGTVKALSAAISISADEKRRVVAVLVLVLLIYTLLFLPRIIYSLAKKYRHDPTFELVTIIPVYFSPLADLFLADLFLNVFMRKGVCDRLLAALCCCKMDQDDESKSNENPENLGADNPAQEEEAEEKV
ncbi:mas-related G-protein coupled receptor member A6-like [Melanotaenia boesemani]|uniref:mas-related G-protein coupled receptor member A6-like n=1 Tax=Melanotaenia boesemani TaxID=1250792 RepID=UPI001C041C1A|nr:mas-related G-protein coupled receptor member A6-like [Melanotaenia boesemani]